MSRLRVSFHTDGTVRDIGPDGDFDLPGTSTLALRYRLEDGKAVDLHPGLTDEAVLQSLLELVEKDE